MLRQFELPVAHLGETGHYVPAPARDPAEIARRQQGRPGRLLAEQQTLGIQLAAETLRRVEAPEDIAFTAPLLAVSGLNTAWHLFAEGADMEVMRRNLQLPRLYGPIPEMRPTSAVLLNSARQGFDQAIHEAQAVEAGVKYGSPRTPDFKVNLGRTLGNASLTLAVVDLGDKIAGSPRIRDSYVQRIVRARETRTLTAARTMIREIGTHPTMAALADPLSDLRVYIARHAPTGTVEAVEAAAEVTA